MNLDECKKIGKDLLKRHGLKQSGWSFKLDKSVKRFGCCRYSTKEISISKVLAKLNDLEDVKDTILHEIAHALCPKEHHGIKWQQKAKEIGCKPERCYDETVKTPPPKFFGRCPGCDKIIKRDRKRRISCTECGKGKFNVDFLFIWSENK